MNNYNTSLEDKIKYICKCEYNYFFNKSNVNGVGLGYKVSKGHNTFKKCIKVFVRKKISQNNLNVNDIIPTYYKGIMTDVIESGISSLYGLTDRIRPVLCGFNMGPISNIYGGTMGCLVTDNHDIFLLSNNHVLASNNKLPLGTSIIQPATFYGGQSPKDIIAGLSQFVPITLGQHNNYVDCAIARILNKKNVSSNIAFIGKIKGVASPRLKDDVKKVGATTELTYGKILSINTTVQIDIKNIPTLFLNQIITTFMSQHGDSGSILLNSNNYAIGLLMSGTTSVSTFNNLSTVLKELNVVLSKN